MPDDRQQLKLKGNRYPKGEGQEPEEGKYPQKIVWQYANGTKFIIDTDTDNVQVYHPSGSSVVFYPDGSVVQMAVGQNVQYTKGGTTLTVDENGDLVVKGHNSVKVQGGGHFEVSGDAGIVVGGKTALVGLGDLGVTAKGNLGIYTDGSLMVNAKSGMTFKTDGSTQFDSAQNHNTNASNIVSKASDATVVETTGGDTSLKASGGDVITKGDKTKIQGGGVTEWQEPYSPLIPSTWT